MNRRTLLWISAALWAGVLLVGCSTGQTNVQATVDAAVVATAAAQSRVQATIDAAVAATQAARGNSPQAGAAPTRDEATPPPAPVSPTATDAPILPSATQAPTVPRCEVVSAGLNLRPGPGLVFDPPLQGLPRGTELQPLAFVANGFPSGQWLEVQVAAGGRRGWVSAGTQFVSCNVAVSALPAGTVPPTPTRRPPTTTPTRAQATLPPPPATATRVPPVAVLPVDGSDGNRNVKNNRGVKEGRNVLLPGFDSYEVSNPMVFRDRIVFRVEVFDNSVGQTDGAGIATVSFTITDPNGETVHEHIERNAGYCVFGGGEPDCEIWRFSEHGNKWPSGAGLRNGTHSVQIVITPQYSDPVSWFWSFQIEAP